MAENNDLISALKKLNVLLDQESNTVKGDNSNMNNQKYVVLQVTLKEKLLGTGSGNLVELENVINRQAALGYRLHTISTAASHSTGLMGGDRIQATMVFERID